MNWPTWLPIRSELAELTPYGAPQISGVTALNTNENPFPLPATLVAQMLKKLPDILINLNRYPDRDAQKLRSELASYLNSQSGTEFSAENIWAANGSNEILQTLMLACGGRGALGFTPSYSVHLLIAKTTGTKWIAGERDSNFEINLNVALAQIAEHRPGLTFVTTPNNPTGTLTPITVLRELAIATLAVDGLLIIDEAYQEFSDEISATTLINEYSNVVVVRTMSKAFAFAGARVGYFASAPIVISAALVARLPYHLSSTTQGLALIALENSGLLLAEVKELKTERDVLATQLKNLGFSVLPSSANFLLFAGFKESSAEAWEKLKVHGILVRDVGLPGYLRVSVGKASENLAFLAAVGELRP